MGLNQWQFLEYFPQLCTSKIKFRRKMDKNVQERRKEKRKLSNSQNYS
jgi:hypothetical protein